MISKSKLKSSLDVRRSGRFVLDWDELPPSFRAESEVRLDSIEMPKKQERLIAELRIGAVVDAGYAPLPDALDNVGEILHNHFYGSVLAGLDQIAHLSQFGSREQVLSAVESLTRRLKA